MLKMSIKAIGWSRKPNRCTHSTAVGAHTLSWHPAVGQNFVQQQLCVTQRQCSLPLTVHTINASSMYHHRQSGGVASFLSSFFSFSGSPLCTLGFSFEDYNALCFESLHQLHSHCLQPASSSPTSFFACVLPSSPFLSLFLLPKQQQPLTHLLELPEKCRKWKESLVTNWRIPLHIQ